MRGQIQSMGVLCLAVIFGLAHLPSARSHGMMLEPVNRGSRWRYNESAPKDYNDNAGFCGGFYTHWMINKGKCGLCGDNFADFVPRAHEHGGVYGKGVIVRNYTAGDTAEVSVMITTNHKGYFLFHLCNMDMYTESEDCFNSEPLLLREGGFEYHLPSYTTGVYNASVVIPSDVICNHCVLRWTYVAGNSWGMCANGKGGVGCGPQEHFKGCADIAVLPPDYALYEIPF